MKKIISIGSGDYIGPEVMNEAMKVLNKISEKFNHKFEYKNVLVGGASIDEFGIPLHESQMSIINNSDALLFGCIGGPKWDSVDSNIRPEKGLLELRKKLETFANLRPLKIFEDLIDASPIKSDVISGVDMIVVRELTGGIYFGDKKTDRLKNGERYAMDIMKYSEEEIRRIAKVAFELAETRNKKLCSVDKENVLDTSKLWRKVVNEVSIEYPDVELSHMFVDNAAMQFVLNPKQFDIVLTANMFGDILSDVASILGGSLGMLPSASIGEKDKVSMYEPSGGSAPDIAGNGIANPIAQILSVAMMLNISFGLMKESNSIIEAISKTIKIYRTADIYSTGTKKVGTTEMGDLIVENI